MTSPLRTGIAALIAIAFSTADTWAAKGVVKITGARLTLADKKVSVAGQPAASGTTVAPGDTVVTGRGSHAELTLPDGTVVRIGQGSSFTYAGSKLVLNQGTALVRVAHKNTTVVSGSRSYTGGPAVVSAEASAKTDGLYILQGTGKVNGAPLIAGQTSVLDRGKDRTFTFDLQKMEASSALVKKFPQTPWIVQTEALATVQHQLLTAKINPGAQSGKGAQQTAAGGVASRVAAQDIVSSTVAKLVSSGAAGTFTVNRAGNPVGLSGTLQFTGSPVSLGSNLTALIKSAANSPGASGSNLQVSGALVFTNSATIQAGSFTKVGAGTLTGATINTGGTLVVSGNSGAAVRDSANFVVNTGISGVAAGAGAITLLVNPAGTLGGGITTSNITAANANAVTGNLAGLTKTGAGLTLTGANTYTGNTTVSGGTLTVINGTTIPGNLVLNGTNTFTFAGGNLSPTATINYQLGTGAVLGGVTLPQQAGQNVTVNGINYISTHPTGVADRLILQPVVH